jgi:hypothetical protein
MEKVARPPFSSSSLSRARSGQVGEGQVRLPGGVGQARVGVVRAGAPRAERKEREGGRELGLGLGARLG